MKARLLNIYQRLLKGIYDTNYAFVPFGISRTVFRDNGVIGWAHYRIFGIRVVKVQETKPWERL